MCSLYVLLQNEEAIMSTALQMNPLEIEEKFNILVNDAVRDYKSSMEGIPRSGDFFQTEVWINFYDLFNLCVDIKKGEAAAAAAAEAAETAGVVPVFPAVVAPANTNNVEEGAAVPQPVAQKQSSAPPQKQPRKK